MLDLYVTRLHSMDKKIHAQKADTKKMGIFRLPPTSVPKLAQSRRQYQLPPFRHLNISLKLRTVLYLWTWAPLATAAVPQPFMNTRDISTRTLPVLWWTNHHLAPCPVCQAKSPPTTPPIINFRTPNMVTNKTSNKRCVKPRCRQQYFTGSSSET